MSSMKRLLVRSDEEGGEEDMRDGIACLVDDAVYFNGIQCLDI